MNVRSFDCDVLVVGGGPAGIGASIGAAQAGARVVVVERHDVLGGMGTAALVNNFCPAHRDGRRLLIGGVFARLRDRLISRKAIYVSPLDSDPRFMEAYDPQVMAEQAMSMCREASVTVRLQEGVASAKFDAPDHALVTLQSGAVVRAAAVCDCTGDAAIAHAAGVPCRFGRDGDHKVMPLTMCFMMGPVDLEALGRALPGTVHSDPITGERFCSISAGEEGIIGRWFDLARQRGEYTIPRKGIPAMISVPGRPQYLTVNIGRVFCDDPTDPVQLTAAQNQGIAQAHEAVAFFKKYWPGMSDIRLVELGRQIGVRESRQIVGLYTLNKDDVLSCRQFDDAIAQCWYPIDVHSPDGKGTTMVWLEQGTHYDIPWRCLVPAEGPANLVVGGRCISATQEAMSSFRVEPSSMALEEAAGVTAALAAGNHTAIRNVDYQAVQRQLLATGGILH